MTLVPEGEGTVRWKELSVHVGRTPTACRERWRELRTRGAQNKTGKVLGFRD